MGQTRGKLNNYDNTWSPYLYTTPTQWNLTSNDAQSFTDITVLVFRVEVCDFDPQQLRSKFSMQLRTSSTPHNTLKFMPHPTYHPNAQVSEDGQVLTDFGSTQWFTLRFDCEFEWDKRYYIELLLEEVHELRLFMVGVRPEVQFASCIQSCMFYPRFYANPFKQIQAGTRLGFEFDFRGKDGYQYVFINDECMGRIVYFRDFLITPFFPTVSVASGKQKIRILPNRCPKPGIPKKDKLLHT
jgi:hypothetical protein